MILYTSQTEVSVPFYDLDPMNVVWHGNYIKYLEIARCDMFARLNYTYFDMQNDGWVYPVVKMTTKFIQPATFAQILVVKAFLQCVEPSMNIKYVILDKLTGKKIFKATTMQIGVRLPSKESTYMAPPRLLEALRGQK